jgi:hypothetical protein
MHTAVLLSPCDTAPECCSPRHMLHTVRLSVLLHAPATAPQAATHSMAVPVIGMTAEDRTGEAQVKGQALRPCASSNNDTTHYTLGASVQHDCHL